jgi:hypothetical protein
MKWSIGNKIASAFGLALAALLVVAVASHDSTAKLIYSTVWVTRSHQVVTGLDEFRSAMKDAETGLRATSTQNVASIQQTEVTARNIGEPGRTPAELAARYKVDDRSRAAKAS